MKLHSKKTPPMHRRWPTPGDPREGSALVMALASVAVVMILMLGFVQLATTVTTGQTRRVQRKRAFYLAEAGLNEAMLAVREGRSGQIGSEAKPALFGDGLFWVDATQDPDHDQVKLDSRGMVAGGDVTLSLVAQRGESSVASLGLFSAGAVTLPAGSRVDSYDSALGAYDPNKSKANAKLGSAGTVQIQGALGTLTLVKGDVTSGPGAPPQLGLDVEVTGDATAARGVSPLPPVTVPPSVPQAGITHAAPTPLTLSGTGAGLDYLELATNTQAVLVGPMTLVLGRLTVQPGAELTLDDSAGPIELYITGDLELAAGAVLTTKSIDPTQLTIQATTPASGSVSLLGSSQFHGTLYAPDAAATVGADFEVFGALIAGSLQFQAPVKIHFDEHLAQAALEGSLPTVASWRILSLGSDSADLNVSPFQILGVDPATLDSPVDSREDQVLTIRYIDKVAVERTYSGLESSFDWSQVDEVLEGDFDGEDVDKKGPRKHKLASTEVEMMLLALVADSKVKDKDLRSKVNNYSPVSSAVLNACIDRSPPMSDKELKKLLIANSPLPADVQARLTAGTTGLTPKSVTDVQAVQ